MTSGRKALFTAVPGGKYARPIKEASVVYMKKSKNSNAFAARRAAI
jgi:hypothetical protein